MAKIGEEAASVRDVREHGLGKEQSLLEMVAYRDMWGKGADSYLQMLYERLSLFRQLLKDDGSIYVLCVAARLKGSGVDNGIDFASHACTCTVDFPARRRRHTARRSR
jgi:hypothetical protein